MALHKHRESQNTFCFCCGTYKKLDQQSLTNPNTDEILRKPKGKEDFAGDLVDKVLPWKYEELSSILWTHVKIVVKTGHCARNPNTENAEMSKAVVLSECLV